METPRLDDDAVTASDGDRLYRHSGIMPPQAWAYPAIMALLWAVIGGGLYPLARHFVGLFVLNMLFTVVFGFVAGFLSGYGTYLGHGRNPGRALILGALSATVALWVAWMVHVWLVQTDIYVRSVSSPLVYLNPATLIDGIADILEHGSWAMEERNEAVTGFWLAAVWVAEAITIYLAALVGASIGYGDEPFCEACNRWVKQTVTLPPVQSFAWDADTVLRVRQGDLGPLDGLQRLPDDSSAYGELQLQRCGDSLFLLTIANVTITEDSDGKATNREPLVKWLQVSKAEYDGIERYLQALPVTEPETPDESDDDSVGDGEGEAEGQAESTDRPPPR